MAPTLKEINATSPATKSSLGEITTDGVARDGGNPEDAIRPIVPSVSENSNEALKLAENNNIDVDVTTTATTATNDHLDSSSAAASSSANTALPPVTATATATATATIQLEDPTTIPPDEMAFLVPPHFTSSNTFHRHLSAFDLSMRCSICGELFRNPVTLLPCHHVFCSLCVRNHFKHTFTGMKRKANCPTCHTPVRMPGSSDYEKGILPNKQLEQQVDAYERCRGVMRESLVRLDVLEKEKAMGILQYSNGQQQQQQQQTNGGGRAVGNGRKRGKATVEGVQEGTRASKRARGRSVAKSTDHSSDCEEVDDDEHDGDYDDGPMSTTSKMPLSAVSNQIEAQSRPQQQQQQLKRKPTTNYHSLKRKKLVELCQKEGLNTHGTEKELRQRHSDFITLYNSECDSDHPRSVKELAMEMKSRENSIKAEAAKRVPRQQSKFMKNLGNSFEAYNGGSISKPTTGNASFDGTLNAGFAEMVAKLKKRKETAAGGVECTTTRTKSDCDAPDPDTASLNHDEAGNSSIAMPASPQSKGVPECGRIDVGRAASPSTSIDSDETVEVSQNCRPEDNDRDESIISSPPSESKAASVAKKCASSKESKSPKRNIRTTARNNRATTSTAHSRVSSLGPWVCDTCTFQNERNTTRTARCEMCGTVRPKERVPTTNEVDVVNIDC